MQDRSNMELLMMFVTIFYFLLSSHGVGLKVRVGVNFFETGFLYPHSYVDVPRTVAEAKRARWVETERPPGPLPSLVLYCPSQDDRILCALFDDTNYVAGTQVALPLDEYQDAIFDWKTLGFTLWSPPATTTGVVRSYWTQQQYFVNEDTLKKSAADRIAKRNNKKTLQEDLVWVSGFNGERLPISTDADKIADTATSGFTRQACVAATGRHYYYNMTATTECTANSLLPWVPLVHSGELVGMGFISFGKLNEKALVKDYFERPDRSAVEMIVPDGPRCLYDLAASPGLVTVHIYFIEAPYLLHCFFQ